MNRTDGSDALAGSDARPSESERGGSDDRRGRTVDWTAFSHAFTPRSVRHRAIEVTVSTDRRRYAPGEPVAIAVEFRNRLPFPIRIRTDSPKRWRWAVDGLPEASRVPEPAPDRPAAFSFARGECKRFRRRWPQRIRIADREWVPVEPDTYTIEAGINRDGADACGLVDRAEIEIRG